MVTEHSYARHSGYRLGRLPSSFCWLGTWGPALETHVLTREAAQDSLKLERRGAASSQGTKRGLLETDGGSSTSRPEEAKCVSEGVSLGVGRSKVF